MSKLTVILLPHAEQALEQVCARSGCSRTDMVSRALVLYDYVDKMIAEGKGLYMKGDEGELEKLVFL